MKNKMIKYALTFFLVVSSFFTNISTVFAYSEKNYSHIDVRFDGTLNIDKKVNGESQVGYPKSIKASISDVQAIVNKQTITTFYEKSGSGKEHEWRADKLRLSLNDTVTIKCKVSANVDGKTYIADFDKTYRGKELRSALENCPAKSGFDFDICAFDLEECFTSTVIFKTQTGGTINNQSNDIVYSGLINGEAFPDIPTPMADDNHEFIGWAQLVDDQLINNPFPEIVCEDSTWVAQFEEVYGCLSFIKTDNNHNPLENVEFTLKNDQIEYTATSDENGAVIFENIKLGTYVLFESKSLAGYLPNNEVYPITLSKDNREITLDNIINIEEIEHLTYDKTVDKECVEYGDTFLYTIHVKNDGNTTLENIVIRDHIDASLQVVSLNDKAYNGENEINYTIPSLQPNEDFTLAIKVKVIEHVKADRCIKNYAYVNENQTNCVTTLLKAKKDIPLTPITPSPSTPSTINVSKTAKVSTNDTSHLTLWLTTLGISTLILSAFVVKKYRNKQH